MKADGIALGQELAVLHAVSNGLSMRLQILIAKANYQGSLSAEDVTAALQSEVERVKSMTTRLHQLVSS